MTMFGKVTRRGVNFYEVNCAPSQGAGLTILEPYLRPYCLTETDQIQYGNVGRGMFHLGQVWCLSKAVGLQQPQIFWHNNSPTWHI